VVGEGESLHEFTSTDSPEKWVRSQRDPTKVIALDLEHWETRGAAGIVEPNVRRLVSVVERLRAGGLKNPVGYYGILPNREYWRAIEGTSSEGFRSWQRDNDYVIPLAAVVDILFPSLYTFYEDPARWKLYALRNIAEAKRLANGKPIYPFIWPQYHDGTALEGRYIPAADWRAQLDLLAGEVDGIVIWGGWAREEGRLKWDDEAQWWMETKDFLDRMNGRCHPEMPQPPAKLEVLTR
jgi:hypothetical protein